MMSDSFHNQQHEQHLIAYLDGELDPDERLLAEKILDENPELVELLEQWRENGEALRSLPRYRLDDSFKARVLADLETVPAVSRNDVRANSVPVSLPTSGSGFVTWRMGVAAIAGLAALLLLMFSLFPNALKDDGVAGKGGGVGPNETPNTDAADADTDSGIGSSQAPQSVPAPTLTGSDGPTPHAITRPAMAKTLKRRDGAKPSDGSALASMGAWADGRSGSVQEVLLVTMPVTSNGIADLELIFIGNSIRVVRSDRPSDNEWLSGQREKLREAMPRIRDDAEAIFVVSTAAQMKKVIEEISKTSRVRALPLPVEANEKARLDEWFGMVDEDAESRLIPYLLWIRKQ